MPALIGGLITGAAGIFGDIMSSDTAQQTNAASISNSQYLQDEQLKMEQGLQQNAEEYNTEMSDTQMQRRVSDLASAGLNPASAISGVGASAPTVSAPSVSTPMPSLQNPGASFGNLGSQVGAAISASNAVKQGELLDQQKQSSAADTATKLAQLPYSGKAAQQGLLNLQEQQGLIHSQANKIAQDWAISQDNFPLQFKQLQNNTQFQQDMQQLQLGYQNTVNQAAKLGIPKAQNDANFQNSWFGRYINPYMSPVLEGVGGAVGTALGVKKLGQGAPDQILGPGALNTTTGEFNPGR